MKKYRAGIEELIELTRGRFFEIVWRLKGGEWRRMVAQNLPLREGGARPVDGQKWVRSISDGCGIRTVILDNVVRIKCGDDIEFDVMEYLDDMDAVREMVEDRRVGRIS